MSLMRSHIPKIFPTDSPRIEVAFPLSTPTSRKITSPQQDFTGQKPEKYAPIKYEVEYGGKKIYLSDVYREARNYPVIFAYVVDEETKKLQPRLLYFSKSHAIWRVAPTVGNVKDAFGKFGKGFEELSCDLPPLLNMALMQHYQKEINEEFSKARTFNEIGEFMNAFTEPIVSGNEYTERFEQECVTTRPPIVELSSDQRSMGVMNPKAKIDVTRAIHPRHLPDFNQVESIEVYNKFYAENLVEGSLQISTCPSLNGEYRYLFAEGILKDTQQPITFLLTVAPEPVELSSYLVPADRATLGYELYTPLMRQSNITSDVRNERNEFGEIIPRRFVLEDREKRLYEEYYAITDYCSSLPLNRILANPSLAEEISKARGGGPPVLETTSKDELAKEVKSNNLKNAKQELIKKLNDYIEQRELQEKLKMEKRERSNKFFNFLGELADNVSSTVGVPEYQEKINAAKKMIAYLSNQPHEPFTEADVKALKNKRLGQILSDHGATVPEVLTVIKIKF